MPMQSDYGGCWDHFYWDDYPILAAYVSVELDWSQGGLVLSDVQIGWPQGGYVLTSVELNWPQGGPVLSETQFKWPQSNYIDQVVQLKWLQQQFSGAGVQLRWLQANYIDRAIQIKWSQSGYIFSDVQLKWSQQQWASAGVQLKWLQANYISRSVILKWFQYYPNQTDYGGIWDHFCWDVGVPTPIIQLVQLKWLQQQFSGAGVQLRWLQGGYVLGDAQLKWAQGSYVNRLIEILWSQQQWVGPVEVLLRWFQNDPIRITKNDWLECITAQGARLEPDIFTGKITWKYGLIAEAQIELGEPIPEDCQCTLYVSKTQQLFNGISRRCTWKPDGKFVAEIYGYLEIAKPSPPKGGLYLGKYTWQNVTIQQLLASDEPSANSNIVGLVFMMNSCIYYELWDIDDADKGIWKWIYTGSPYTILKVYSDGTALAAQANRAALNSSYGYYHDAANKTLYIRLSDETSPYYHCISVPNIWDGIMPVRLGTIASAHKTDNVIYWETANGDIPFEVINNLLTAAGLEYEESVRGGVCYLDVADQAGRGSTASPANIYAEGINILNLQQIDLTDARYTVDGVILRGYGQGSSGILAGCHINQGRGGRFVRLEDSSMHSESMAESFADNYLAQHRQPDHRVVLDVPLFENGQVNLRKLGDLVKVELPSEKFYSWLRTQQIEATIGGGSRQTLTVGDRLITPEQILQAMKSASDKYRKHLEDTTEAFDWSWNENLDNNLSITNKFEIKDDVLKIQTLELIISIDYFRAATDVKITSRGGSGGEGGGGGGCGEDPDTTHPHPVAQLKAIKSPDFAVVSLSTHVHPPGTLALSPPSVTDTAIKTLTTASDAAIKGIKLTKDAAIKGINAPSDTAIKTLGTDCCTAVNCGKRWVTGAASTISVITGVSITATIAAVIDVAISSTFAALTNVWAGSTVAVATSVHIHTLSGKTDIGDTTTGVSVKDHEHAIEAFLTEASEIDTSDIKDALTVWTTGPGGGEVPLMIQVAQNYGSNPDMYLHVYIQGAEITGSPFVVSSTEKTAGPILLNPGYVNAPGSYELKYSLTNKTSPGEACRCRATSNIRGRFFVDSVIGAGG